MSIQLQYCLCNFRPDWDIDLLRIRLRQCFNDDDDEDNNSDSDDDNTGDRMMQLLLMIDNDGIESET